MQFVSPVLATLMLMLVLAAGNAVADACNTARAAKLPVRSSPGGQWLFTDDGTGIEIRPCANANAEWCATLITLPRDADQLPPAERALLCGSLVMGNLRPTADRTQIQRLEGWIVDPQERLEGGNEPVHHAATLTLTSDAQACVEVKNGPAGIFVERYALMRSVVPRAACRYERNVLVAKACCAECVRHALDEVLSRLRRLGFGRQIDFVLASQDEVRGVHYAQTG